VVRVLFLLLFFPLFLMSAVPDDISSNQRAWYDAVDIDADGDYTDNPVGGSAISLWKDKSGQNNDVSSSGDANPSYVNNSPEASRNGVDFDGSNDFLKDSNDIWSGSVSSSEIFIVSKVDRYRQSFIFSSMTSHHHRLSSHLPWGGDSDPGTSYFDHGQCCGNPARLSGNISMNNWSQYFWHFIAEGSTYQAIVQDGKVKLSDSNGVGVYDSAGGAFSLGQKTHNGGNFYGGEIYEAIFYQQSLNTAQRRIMSAYLSAKWNKAFASSPTYVDVYVGDDYDYDFFVGGIGKESDGSQTIGTSQGLTITNNNFLANGKYVLAGVNYLTGTPQTGIEETGWLGDNDTTNSYEYRASRLWYIDNTGTGGTVNLSFSASAMGIPVENGSEYGLLCRNGTGGDFFEVAVGHMVSSEVAFDYLPTDDICTIGKKVDMSISKTSCVLSDLVNATVNPKRIPGAIIRYAIEVKNKGVSVANDVKVSDSVGENFNETTITNLQIQSGACDCLGIASASDNGANGTSDGINPVVLDFGEVLGGSVSAPTKECGYFEVNIK
jgi:uncharacterized repeat protein (TIGR01451 family)